MNKNSFFRYAKDRYQLMLDKEADSERPWTQDPILQKYRFCNVFRENDKTTKWIRNHLTDEGYGSQILPALVIARWFNRIETLKLLLPRPEQKAPYWRRDMFYEWKSAEVRRRLRNVKPLCNGAYIISSPAGMNKLNGLIKCIEIFLKTSNRTCEILGQTGFSLEEATELLSQFPFQGLFSAYEVVTDLRHTDLLRDAPDIMTWANVGPGSARGAGRVEGRDPGYYKRGKSSDRDAVQVVMQRLLKASQKKKYWPRDWPSWEMRDVEHTLCEFDKYERTRLGQGRPKQLYHGGRV